ncbi:anthranilate phosphoribosyltransferase [Aeromonas simiae]|uniref:Anthranilate phosphoribosyltransferase n=1 Tax=Aeromonas simiae TaxID=218936 RepID=A0A5J6WUR3_9GAMM|nr:anthranilate phosphoribosyltransferase [Aeromonas simiae]MDO2949846.1 anthranilate phosphoribosyltransferase [Aeromonas simiae]MDO2953511.1 anthranilate phosphoribosyltransferase [Aeromonas simiae]MDO2957177.1 anthranilate phosphoribosyltransferase [Aeromonas simiae]QFI54004.1 anthranilate phosphoribosyltransferase [Aeromonas simiae]
MHHHLNTLYQGQSLTREAAREAFGQVVRGEVDPIVLASLLTALKIKGETPEEITGAAEALLAESRPFPRPDYDFCDIVGTGGDGLNTINVSTTSALVAAACGLKVAKHGNRSVSSKSGSSDLLDQMGIRLDMSPELSRRCLDEVGVCFLFAPQYHAGVRHAMPVRQALKTRTLFNVLGPLINPARPTFQLMGVYAPELVRPLAETLLALGLKTGMVVHGAGLDEVAIHGPTQVAQIRDGEIREFMLTPADFGLETYPVSAIRGGEPAENRAITAAILEGHGAPAHNAAIAANVAPLLLMAGKAKDLKEAAAQVLAVLASGKAATIVTHLAALSRQEAQ